MPAATGTFTAEFAHVIAQCIDNAEGSWGNYEAGLCLNVLGPNDVMASVQELTDSVELSNGYARIALTGTWTFAAAQARYATIADWENTNDPEDEFPDWETAATLFVSVTVGGTERLAWFLGLGSAKLLAGDTLELPDGLRFELDDAEA